MDIVFFPDKSKSLKYDGIKSIIGGDNSAGGMSGLSRLCCRLIKYICIPVNVLGNCCLKCQQLA